ncbi:hypothetical protein Esti_004268 [Eimeria stiedai]
MQTRRGSRGAPPFTSLLCVLLFPILLHLKEDAAASQDLAAVSPPHRLSSSPGAASPSSAAHAALPEDDEEDEEEEEGPPLLGRSSSSSSSTAVAATSPVGVSVEGSAHRSHHKMFLADSVVEELLQEKDYLFLLEKARTKDKAAIIMFYSAWCPHCFAYRTTFSRLASDLQNRFFFAALNCVESSALLNICGTLSILSIPAIKLFVPASIHRKLPPSEQKPKQINVAVRRPLWEALEVHSGGLLESFDEKGDNPMAIHALSLPAGDLFSAVQYAARQTLQTIPKSELPLSLGALPTAFEHLNGMPCVDERWGFEEVIAASHYSRHSSEASRAAAEAAAAEELAQGRMHDAIRGLQFFLASWVLAARDTLTRADEYALIDLLELVRATIPLKSVRKAAALATLHLHASGERGRRGAAAVGEEARRYRLRRDEAQFAQVLEVYNELDEALSLQPGQRASDWRRWVGTLSFGEEAPPLPPLQEPLLNHCSTLTCSVWMLLHALAEGASHLAQLLIEHPKCGPEEVFYKRKGQALPIYLLREEEAKGREADFEDIAERASLSTEELIEWKPSLGCMVVPSFELAFYVFNALKRFLGCETCRRHFTIQFARRTHGLLELQPPEAPLILKPPAAAAAGAASAPLLEEFRSQEAGTVAAWEERRVEQSKLDKMRTWLWRLHNAVNVRTAADATVAAVKAGSGSEASAFANCDVRWPPKLACSACRMGPPPTSGLISPALLAARDADPDIFAVEEEISDFDQKRILQYLAKSQKKKAWTRAKAEGTGKETAAKEKTRPSESHRGCSMQPQREWHMKDAALSGASTLNRHRLSLCSGSSTSSSDTSRQQ